MTIAAAALDARQAPLWARRLPVALGRPQCWHRSPTRLCRGLTRNQLTVAIVLLFAAVSITHALIWRGPAWATRLIAVTAVAGCWSRL
jgi:hypothetical protein